MNLREKEKIATYTPEPIWRSSITMALLTWIGMIISLIEIFPFYKIIEPVIKLFNRQEIKMDIANNYVYVLFFVVLTFLLILIFWLRNIAKREIRHPLFFNYAISGFGRKITIEKIHIDNCPKCGGKMKYYNKPIEWTDRYYSNGRTKREVTKRVPALQCKRNFEHWFKVDPTEDKLK